MIKIKGKIDVDPLQKRIVVDLSPDIVQYYNWFITKKYWTKFQIPLHGSHVTIYNPKIHSAIQIDWDYAKKFHGKKVEMDYDPYLIRGGMTKGFVMFYMKIYSEELDNIKKELRIIENDNYRGMHITVANGKHGNVTSYWPETITIK